MSFVVLKFFFYLAKEDWHQFSVFLVVLAGFTNTKFDFIVPVFIFEIKAPWFCVPFNNKMYFCWICADYSTCWRVCGGAGRGADEPSDTWSSSASSHILILLCGPWEAAGGGGGCDQFIISICLHSPSPFLSSHFCPSLSVFVCTFAFFCFSCDWVLFIRFLKLVLPEFLSFLVGFSVKFVSFLYFRFLLTALEAIFYFLSSRSSACFLKATYFIFMVLSSVIFLYVAPKAYQLPLYLLLLFTLKEHPSIFFSSSWTWPC